MRVVILSKRSSYIHATVLRWESGVAGLISPSNGLCGRCDTQRVLPFGTPDEVRADVRQRVEQLAPGGGFIFCTIHNIQADVAPENIIAMYDALKMCGCY